MSDKKKKVVVIAGGNGSGVSVGAFKSHIDRVDIAAIIPVSDAGGSSGRLSHEFGILPVGDTMRAVIAMSRYDSAVLKRIFYRNRFHDLGPLDGHNLGNLFLGLTIKYADDFVLALDALHQAVEAVGRVYPVTTTAADLCAKLENDDVIVGEHDIDRPNERKSEISRIWLDPLPAIYAPARDALTAADLIVLGPGSLYCSIVAGLVVEGVQEAIEKSGAKLIYIVGNAYEKNGEAGPSTLSGFVTYLERYLPRPLDAILFNDRPLSEGELAHYDEKGWTVIKDDLVDPRIIRGDFEKAVGGLDSEKLGTLLCDIFCSDA